MAHLRARDIGVPRVFAMESGETALEAGEWTYEVHGIPSGVDLYEDAISWTPFLSAEHARSTGKMMARMHLAASGFEGPQRKVQPLVASFTIFASPISSDGIHRYLSSRPTLFRDAQTRRDCEEALNLFSPFHDELNPLVHELHSLWTHNDLHASNLFWSKRTLEAHATAVIDFGLADRTNAVYDLAQAIERNVVGWLTLAQDPTAAEGVSVHLDHLWAILDGYESIRPLSAVEAAVLPPMVALSHVEFALTEADYFLAVLHSPEKARVATHDYLVGHAKWFRGVGARKLLDPLRRWAETRGNQVVRA